MQVLVVDDDRELVELLAFALHRHGFGVLPAHDLSSAIASLQEQQPDMALLDVNLGAGVADGFEVLRRLRERSDIPVLMLSGRDSDDDRVRGLDLGADDYVVKPFSHRELLARLRSLLRRQRPLAAPGAVAASMLRVGSLSLDAHEHAAAQDGRALPLSPTEFRLLQCLMAHEGAVVPTRTVMREVWGHDHPSGMPTVRVTVSRLRRKLEANRPAEPRQLATVPGEGIRLIA